MPFRIPAALLLFAWFAATAWIRPLALPDEGRYASVAWEMLAAHHWAVPTLDGLPFSHKPPLFYWLADAAMAVLGVNVFAARLPSLLGATALGWALYRFTRDHAGEGQARITALVIATTPYFYFGAQYANMDMLVAACIGCCVLLAAEAAIRIARERDARLVLWGAYIAAALGVLAKGLIGCVLPAAIIIVWLAVTRHLRVLRGLISIVGLLLFAAVALPWMVSMELRNPGFLQFFFIEQQFQRFAGAGFNNPQPVWFYLPLLAVLTLPWCAALMFCRPARVARPGAPPAVGTLMVCWITVVLVFFSIPQSKLIGYVLPAVPPIAWLAAAALAASGTHGIPRRYLRSIGGLAGVVVVATVLWFGLRGLHSSRSLALALEEHRAAGEPVIFVDTYPYDFVFYARVRPPIPIVKDWADPRLVQSDTWPREFLDGARFSAGAAGRTLVAAVPATWGAQGATRAWIVAPARRGPPVPGAQEVASTGELTLWRASR